MGICGSRGWQFGLVCAVAMSWTTLKGNYVLAQITPDLTLGAEGSIFTPNVTIGDLSADGISGGALRGTNLFHSFSEFNVANGQRVYFANPAGIENILSRVTGTNPSQILGTLGVDGQANLFFLNPNGIIFGANARLDVAGSFLATTANSLVFENGSQFSATNPEAPPLLTINLTPGLQYGSGRSGTITNAAHLAVGQNLTLAAGNLELQGQLQAGGDLTLLATDSVQVRDSIANPFIAFAGGQLLVQGDRTVDIFALNHPQSGFFSREALVLRSGNTVQGDAQYTTGGNFSVEQLDGDLGDLSSPGDPIIRAGGDVRINTYQGASLHILAGGQVNLGRVTITGADAGVAGVNFLAENVTLSDGTTIAIDGSAKPTLDVRAGMNPAEIGGTLGLSGVFDVLNPANPVALTRTSADINIDSISINASDGAVFLTNHYKADSSLSGGAIAVRTIRTDDNSGRFSGNSGSVTIDSRAGVTVGDRINTSSASGDAGDITLIAQDAIALDNSLLVSSTAGSGRGGDINIRAGSVALTNGGQIQSNTSGRGDAGDVTIVANGQVLIDGQSGNRQSEILSRVNSNGRANGGDINIQAGSVSVTNNARLRTGVAGIGNGGSIRIIANGTASFSGESRTISNLEQNAIGNAGDIYVEAESVFVSGFARLEARTDGQGDAGDVTIIAHDTVSFNRADAFSSVERQGVGNAGNITIEARAVTLQATLQSNTLGRGNAGNVTIIARDSVSYNRGFILSRVNSSGEGQGGDIRIETGSLSMVNGTQLIAETQGRGNAGNVRILARDSVSFEGMNEDERPTGAFSNVRFRAEGDGGDIYIQAASVSVTQGARLDASTSGEGDAGKITINTQGVNVGNEGRISASTFGQRDAGDISIKATDSVVIANDGIISSDVSPSASGNGGDIEIQTPSLFLSDGGRVETRTLGFIPTVLAQAYANTSYEAAVLDNTPVAYWRLDETSGLTAFDASGNNFNGTYQNGVTLGLAGVSGTAAEFERRNRAAVAIGTIAPGSNLDIQNQSFTVEAWIKPDESPPSNQVYFGMHSNQQDNQSLHLRVRDNGSIEFGYWDDDLETPQRILTFGDNWYHLVTRYDQATDTSTVFVNGTPIRSGTQGPFLGNEPSVFIGSWQRIGSEPFDGLIDEVAVYDTALSPETIAAHYSIGLRNIEASNATFTDQGANAGYITVNASSITLSGVSPSRGFSSGLFSGTEGSFSGQGGDISITTDSLQVTDGAVLSARTLNQSNGGNIEVQANTVEVTGGGELLTTALSSGAAGDIAVNATSSVTLAGSDPTYSDRVAQFGMDAIDNDGAASGFSARTQGAGSAGNLLIQTGQFRIQDGAVVSAATAGGEGGSIKVEANTFEATSGGRLLTTTSGDDPAGNISLSVNESVTLAGNETGLFADTTPGSSGSGGSVAITTQELLVRDGARVALDAEGSGNAGNLDVTARSVELDTGARLTAATASGNGGNITLRVQDLLLLRRGSQISTSAGRERGGGDGGNIEIDTGFIVAVPEENSDITADAFQGMGGNINITAQGIFGIDFREELTPYSDITASSELGVDGVVEINRPDVDPSRGLAELPSELVDAQGLIDRSCSATSGEPTSSFVVTGRGGLPPNPTESLSGDTVWSDLRLHAQPAEKSPSSQVAIPENQPTAGRLVEAQGWVKTPDGQVVLVAQAPEERHICPLQQGSTEK